MVETTTNQNALIIMDKSSWVRGSELQREQEVRSALEDWQNQNQGPHSDMKLNPVW